jgi:Domain of unknown function (DUF4139)/N-terminal domain of unknown function (DUF4140)
MLRTAHLSLLFLCCFSSQATERNVPTTITAARVFLSGAEITRTGKVELAKGTSTLLFAGLSEEVDPANIQVSGTGAFMILGVQHRLNYAEEKQDRAEVVDLRAKIKALDADIAREQSLLAVLEKEDARLGKNDVIAGDQGLALEQLRSINDYLQNRQEALALKRLERLARIAELNEALGKLHLQLAQVQGRKARPTSEVLVEVSSDAAVDATIVLKYMVRSAGWSPSYDIRVADITKPLQLTYKAQVYQNTGEDWDKVQLALSSGEPNRDAIMPELRVWGLDFGYQQPAASAATPNDNAGVRDVRGIIRDASTGEPLPFVNVTLHDANGALINGTTSTMDGYYAIAIPMTGRTLQFTFIGYHTQSTAIHNGTININMAVHAAQLRAVEVVTGGVPARHNAPAQLHAQMGVVRTDRMSSRRMARRSRDEFSEDEYEGRGENALATTMVAPTVVQRATNFEFTISVPYTIPSDGKNHHVGVQEQELPCSFRYYCTPKLDLDAFLFAEVTGWESMNLLAGPAYIYFEGTYVGESLLDLGGVGDTLDINLGRDKGVTVQRTKRKDYSQRAVVGGKRTESVGWEIAVRNNKPQAIDLIITDQYPVAVRSEIEVTLDDSGSGPGMTGTVAVKKEKGFLTWKVKVEPRTNQQWRFGYSVKVPKEKVVVLE